MNLLPFGKLAAHKPRKFVPDTIDLGDWPQIAPLFDQLETRAAASSAAALEQWLLDWSEMNAALDEEASRRYIAMTCHTDHAEAEKAYLHFVEHVEPQLKPRQFALEKIYVAVRAGQTTNEEQALKRRYEVFDRDVKNHVTLFRPENVALETEDAKLCQQYQKLIGAQTVHFRGEEKTLVQLGRYLEEPDRALRQEAWELVVKRRLVDVDKCEEIFDQLIQLRTQIAKNAGFENYRDFAFRQKGRFDYTPENCFQFHDAVETEIMPAVREIQHDRQRQLHLEKLRPWDLAVDPQNRAPLKPFAEVGEMVARTQKIFNQLDAELAAGFQQMQDLKLLDLDNRKGKAPGGYQSTLNEARVPFIFMNAIGLQRDVETLLHEAAMRSTRRPRARRICMRIAARRLSSAKSPRWRWSFWATSFSKSFIRPPRQTAPARRTSKASSAFFRGWRRWTRSSTGFTRTPATRAPSARPPIYSSWTASAATWIIPATRKSAHTRGTGSYTFSCIRFTTSNMALRSLARCRSGQIRGATR